ALPLARAAGRFAVLAGAFGCGTLLIQFFHSISSTKSCSSPLTIARVAGHGFPLLTAADRPSGGIGRGKSIRQDATGPRKKHDVRRFAPPPLGAGRPQGDYPAGSGRGVSAHLCS